MYVNTSPHLADHPAADAEQARGASSRDRVQLLRAGGFEAQSAMLASKDYATARPRVHAGGGAGAGTVQRKTKSGKGKGSTANNYEAAKWISYRQASAHGLVAKINQYADESVFSDDEMFDVLRGMKQIGRIAAHGVALQVNLKAQEELVDNINTPHLTFLTEVLEIYRAVGENSSKLLQSEIDLSVIKAMPIARLAGRDLVLFKGILAKLSETQQEELLDSEIGKDIRKTEKKKSDYGWDEANQDMAKYVAERLMPGIKAQLRTTAPGLDALAIVQRFESKIGWRRGQGAGVEWADGGVITGMTIGVDQTPATIAQYLIHECHHIRMLEAGTTAIPDETGLTDYVRKMVYEEVDATIQSAKATLSKPQGKRGGQIPGERDYLLFLKKHQREGDDEVTAHQKARDKLYKAYATGTGVYYHGTNYSKYYAEEWKKANKDKDKQ